MRVLAIDQGTSATKAMIVDGDHVLGTAEVEVPVTTTSDGGVELDPKVMWESVLDAGRRAIAAAGGAVPDAIGLANQGETVLAWDRATSRPLTPAIVWQDRRASSICDELRDEADELASVTGLELDPYFAAPKFVWVRENRTRHGVVTTSDVWLLHLLTGAFATDVATASRTLLLDLDTASWSPEAIAIFGLDDEALPAIVANAELVGATTAFGPRPIPVTGTCVDQQAALFAESCTSPGEAKCTFGTGAFLLACTGETPTRSTNGLVGCVAWRRRPDDAVTYCLDGQVFTVGSAVRWLTEIGLIDEPADLDRVGGDVDTTAGVSFVPGLAGLGAPFWKASARGAFTGLSLSTTREHMVRAVIEGIAAQVAWLARAAGDDMGTALTSLRVDGGLTRSHTLLQVQADLLQAPVEVYPSPHATALGVGAFARIGAGDDTGDRRAWRPSARVEPRVGADEADERLERWRAAAEATLEL